MLNGLHKDYNKDTYEEEGNLLQVTLNIYKDRLTFSIKH